MNTAQRTIELLILCGCSRCGRRIVDEVCIIDALHGDPIAAHCSTCADIVEAGRAGQEAALKGWPPGCIRFDTEEEQQEFEREFRRTIGILRDK